MTVMMIAYRPGWLSSMAGLKQGRPCDAVETGGRIGRDRAGQDVTGAATFGWCCSTIIIEPQFAVLSGGKR
ncbi:unnamed protein product [Calypogeia fissa]